jgi:hypothetical protein
MALAHAGQVAVLTGAPDAAAPVSRLLRMLRGKGMTDWADEALDVAALVLADRSPEAAAVALCAVRRSVPGTVGSPLRSRLISRRAAIEEALGPERWAPAPDPCPSTRRSDGRSRRCAGSRTSRPSVSSVQRTPGR